MRGQYSGVAKFIKDVSPRTMFGHCRAHLFYCIIYCAKVYNYTNNYIGLHLL